MADEADLAGEYIEHWSSELEQTRRAERERELKQAGTVYCDECGDEIPAERREKHPHVRFCVPCKTLLEAEEARRRALSGG